MHIGQVNTTPDFQGDPDSYPINSHLTNKRKSSGKWCNLKALLPPEASLIRSVPALSPGLCHRAPAGSSDLGREAKSDLTGVKSCLRRHGCLTLPLRGPLSFASLLWQCSRHPSEQSLRREQEKHRFNLISSPGRGLSCLMISVARLATA